MKRVTPNPNNVDGIYYLLTPKSIQEKVKDEWIDYFNSGGKQAIKSIECILCQRLGFITGILMVYLWVIHHDLN